MQFKKIIWTNCCTCIRNSTLVQKAVVTLLIMGMAVIWPLCLVRETAETISGDEGLEFTEELQVGMYVEQKFRAEQSVLRSIAYVLGFDPESTLEGEFLFELLDEQGNMLYSINYPYNLTPDYRYCDLEVNLRLHKNREYTYRLTNLSVTKNVPVVMYSVEESMYAINDCGMIFNGQNMGGESAARYIWSVPYPWKRIMLYWGGMGIVAFCIYELEEIRKARK